MEGNTGELPRGFRVMARPLRIEIPGAYYHVMNRGNQRQTVFRGNRDYHLFTEKLAAFADLFAVDVLAYCLMPNHFHLYVRVPQANLSRFMQSLLTSFTVVLNRRRKSSGHLFQGRFKAELVEAARYGNEVSRYLHLNPVRTAVVMSLPATEKRRVLEEYPWSSFGACTGLRECPAWLKRAETLQSFGEATEEAMGAYRRYVEDGLLRGVDNPADAVAVQAVIGDESFVDQVKRKWLLRRDAARGEEPALSHIQCSLPPAEVLAAVAQILGLRAEDLTARRSVHRVARRQAMYCVCRLCRYSRSLTELAALFGVSVAGLARTRDRAAVGRTAGETLALADRVRRQLSIA